MKRGDGGEGDVIGFQTTSITRWHFSKDLKGGQKASHENISGKSIAGRRNSRCKGPDVEWGMLVEEQQGDECGWSEEGHKGEGRWSWSPNDGEGAGTQTASGPAGHCQALTFIFYSE